MKTHFLSLFSFGIIGIMLLAPTLTTTIFAQTPDANHSALVWLTTRSVTAQKDLANSILGGSTADVGTKDIILMHMGSGQAPTQAHADALKAATVGVTDARKGFEFFTAAEMDQWADWIADRGFGWISLNYEGPNDANALAEFQEGKEIADREGLGYIAIPSRGISAGQYADDIAQLVDRFHLQAQSLQPADTTCDTAAEWVADTVDILEAANSNLEGRITVQLSLVDERKAPGKTPAETVRDCIDRIEPEGDVDGLRIWWTGASWDSGDYQDLLTYYEETYS